MNPLTEAVFTANWKLVAGNALQKTNIFSAEIGNSVIKLQILGNRPGLFFQAQNYKKVNFYHLF